MATGRRAFNADTAAVVQDAILNQAPAPAHEVNPTIPPKLEQVINRAIEKDRELRYPSAAEMRADLQALAEQPSKRRGRARWKWLTAVAAICVAVIAAGVYWRSHRPPKLTDKDTIVIGDFDNKTEEAVFDDTLKRILTLQLEQSPFLELLSERNVNNTLKDMGRHAGDRLTPEVTRQVCLATSSRAMLIGSITRLDNQYVVGLSTTDCNTGTSLAEVQERVTDREAVLKGLNNLTIKLRGELGESTGSVERYATPVGTVEKATTSSLEALKAYSVGYETRNVKGPAAALPFFKRAVELDPNFAEGYNELAVVYGNLNEVRLAAENARRAYQLRDRALRRGQFSIEEAYYIHTTGELEKAAHTCELHQRAYPRDYGTYARLGFIYSSLGRLQENLDATREALRLNPNGGYGGNLANAYQFLNRLDEADRAYQQIEVGGRPGDPIGHYQLAFLQGDTAQMARIAEANKGKPIARGLLLATRAGTEGWYGKFQKARELTQSAIAGSRQDDAQEAAAAYEGAAALREVESGNRRQAVADADTALKLATNRDVLAMAALTFAESGDAARSEKLATSLDTTFPLDTLVQKYWLPTIRAAVALQRKDPSRAVTMLEAARGIELGQPTIVTLSLCPAYVRGEAYLMLRDGNAAAAEFQKFIDHYGRITNFPWGALARLGLARAYAIQAETDPAAREKARTAYQNFLTLWKDADPDIPIYKQAKAEYAKLR
jgi:tetratricopeptide (TPR) repeat protein